MDVIINNPPAATQMPAQSYAPVQATPYGYGPMAYGPYHDHHGPGFLLPLLLIGGVLLLKRRRFMGRRWMAGGPGRMNAGMDTGQDMAAEMRDKFRQHRDRFVKGTGGQDSALQIARERYAKGEINADEYEALRRTLGGELRPDRPTTDQSGEGDLKI
ncbi:SHOCT domain-containing protein [Deinococcus sp.]|uniref:SHOCT domain-containing protein n=1 Tax=Deinococcus sp. TaxID=47478 RepID=UPI002869A171|nr:SHOCT domain-containing protein [Deinococcus sp.]